MNYDPMYGYNKLKGMMDDPQFRQNPEAMLRSVPPAMLSTVIGALFPQAGRMFSGGTGQMGQQFPDFMSFFGPSQAQQPQMGGQQMGGQPMQQLGGNRIPLTTPPPPMNPAFVNYQTAAQAEQAAQAYQTYQQSQTGGVGGQTIGMEYQPPSGPQKGPLLLGRETDYGVIKPPLGRQMGQSDYSGGPGGPRGLGRQMGQSDYSGGLGRQMGQPDYSGGLGGMRGGNAMARQFNRRSSYGG
jgi:hypothetical protein